MGSFVNKTGLQKGQWVSFEHLYKKSKETIPEELKGPIYVKHQIFDDGRCTLINEKGQELDYLPRQDSISPWKEPWKELPIPGEVIERVKVLSETDVPRDIRNKILKG